MITLFRRFRQKLIDSGSVTKYLLYAVGEITLVMIGILLALQVNNWNEERKGVIEEIKILNILQEDLETAKAQSVEYLRGEERNKQVLMNILIADSLEVILNSELTDSLFQNAIWVANFQVPVISAYNDLKNAGKTGLIRSQKIREQLSTLDLNISNLLTLLGDRLTVQQIRIDDIAAYKVNYLRLLTAARDELNHITIGPANNYKELMEDQEVRNLLGIKLTMTITNVEYRLELLNQITAILNLLDEELAVLEGT